jgi:hypothetical protein
MAGSTRSTSSSIELDSRLSPSVTAVTKTTSHTFGRRIISTSVTVTMMGTRNRPPNAVTKTTTSRVKASLSCAPQGARPGVEVGERLAAVHEQPQYTDDQAADDDGRVTASSGARSRSCAR